MPESPHPTALSVNLHLKPDATAKGMEVASAKYVQIRAHPCEVTIFLPREADEADAAIDAIVAALLSLKSLVSGDEAAVPPAEVKLAACGCPVQVIVDQGHQEGCTGA